jgi:hypothetical protein
VLGGGQPEGRNSELRSLPIAIRYNQFFDRFKYSDRVLCDKPEDALAQNYSGSDLSLTDA